MFFEFLVPENHIIDIKIIVLSRIVPEILSTYTVLATILDVILFCEPLQGVSDSHHKFSDSLSSYEENKINRIFP